MMCFSEKEPPGPGPRRVSKAEIESTFTPLFNIIYIKDATFDSNIKPNGIEAYIVSAVRS